MARRRRLAPVGIPQHIIQRGNDRQKVFASDADVAAYANWLYEGAKKYDVKIHAWVFMTNHVHLLATPGKERSISAMMQFLGRYYVRYFNAKYQRTGTLWEGRYKSCLVQTDTYFLLCQRYIELNPVRARMVGGPADYVWSSYRANAMGLEAKLRTPHQVYEQLGKTKAARLIAYRALFQGAVEGEMLGEIRAAANQGLVLGTDAFKDEVEQLTDQRARLQKEGRGG